MRQHVTPQEARAALDAVDRVRLRVVDEIDLPKWYWWGLALGWIALGFITDLGHPWLTSGATLAFGAVHSTVAPRVASGRHRSSRLSVSAEVAGRRTTPMVIGAVALLGVLTVALALAARADGARHPVTMAGVVIAVIILLGGPRLLAVIRERAASPATR